jgi:hypothetical protein
VSGHPGGLTAVEADHLGRISDRSPQPRTVGDEPEEHPWRGSPFGGKAFAVPHAEIAPGDGRPRRGDVALDELADPAHLHAAERPDGLEDDQDAAWVSGQVSQLHVALGYHHLEGVTGPAKPDWHGVGAAVLAVGRQHCRSGGFQQRPHPFDPSSAHLRSVVESMRRDGKGPMKKLTDHQIRSLGAAGKPASSWKGSAG